MAESEEERKLREDREKRWAAAVKARLDRGNAPATPDDVPLPDPSHDWRKDPPQPPRTTATLSEVPPDTSPAVAMQVRRDPTTDWSPVSVPIESLPQAQRVGEPRALDAIPRTPLGERMNAQRKREEAHANDWQGHAADWLAHQVTTAGDPFSDEQVAKLNAIGGSNSDPPDSISGANPGMGKMPAPSGSNAPAAEQTPQGDGGRGLAYAPPADQGSPQASAPVPQGPTTEHVPASETALVAPRRQADIYNRSKDVADAPLAIGDAEADKFDQQANAQMLAVEDQRKQIAEAQAWQEQRNQELQDRQNDLQERAKAATEGKIDPEHFWGSRSMPQKIMSVIALALGGFSAGLTGGPNPAMGLLQKAIDNDIAGQEANLKSRESGIHQERGLLADQMKSFGDANAAKAATRVAYLQAAIMQVDAIGMKATGPVQKARAQDLSAQLYKQLSVDQARMNQYMPAHAVVTNPGTGAAKPVPVWEQGKFIAEQKIPERETALREAQSVMASGGPDGPEGIGPGWDKFFAVTPDYIISQNPRWQRAAENRQIIERARMSTIKDDAARMNPASLEIVRKATGNTAPQLNAWLADENAKLQAEKSHIAASMTPNQRGTLSEQSAGGRSAVEAQPPVQQQPQFRGTRVSDGAGQSTERARPQPPPALGPPPKPTAPTATPGAGGKADKAEASRFAKAQQNALSNRGDKPIKAHDPQSR